MRPSSALRATWSNAVLRCRNRNKNANVGFAGVLHLHAALGAPWMLKDVFLPSVGPSMAAAHDTSTRMHRAIERGGLAGMLLVAVLVAVSDRRILGQPGRWNWANTPWIKVGLAVAVIAMSFGLLVSMRTPTAAGRPGAAGPICLRPAVVAACRALRLPNSHTLARYKSVLRQHLWTF